MAVAGLRPPAGPIAGDDLTPDSPRRAGCEYPRLTPTQMALPAGKTAPVAAQADAEQANWVLHAGVGPQCNQGRPVHHDIQNGIAGRHGNALKSKQNSTARSLARQIGLPW